MRILLEETDAARFEIDLTEPGGPARVVALTELRGVGLDFARGAGAARVRSLRGTQAALATLEWPLPRGGRVTASSHGALGGVSIELDAAASPGAGPEATGRVAVGRVDAGAVAIELGAGPRIAVDVAARAVAVEQSPERAGHVSAERLDLGNLQTGIAGWLIRLSNAVIDDPRVDWRGEGEVLVGAGAARLGGVSLSGGGLSLEIARADLPEGLRTSGGVLVVPHLVIPELMVQVDDVADLFRRPRPTEPAPPPEDLTNPAAKLSSGTPAGHPFDFRFLDRVTGRLDVDLTMEMTIPVLGKRKATHHFRVPIVSGVINYRELERDLSSFEDAFIDLNVRGQALVLERTVPIIPGLEKPLVFWDLTAADLELAKKKRLLRLRTIPRLRLAPKSDKGDKPSGFQVRRLGFDNIDVALALAPPREGEADAVWSASAADLRLGGRIDHGPQRAGSPTEVTVVAERLAAGPAELTVGRIRLELASVEVGQVAEASLVMDGFRPRAARLLLRQVELRNLKINW